MNILPDMREAELIREYAKHNLGPDAEPTADLRLICTGSEARLQQAWRGRYGKLWFDVPRMEVAMMPPRTVETATTR